MLLPPELAAKGIPALCLFCESESEEGMIGVWELSDEQAQAEGRPPGARTMYRICALCEESYEGNSERMAADVERIIPLKRK